jgi:glycosyltransferase involved in cell wall biosynthesis
MPTSSAEPEALRIAVVTAHPPGKGSLNEYAYHFVRYLRQKPEVAEVILLADELPAGQVYRFETAEEDPELAGPCYMAPVTVLPCWRFDAPNNALRIRAAVRQTRPDAVLFNIQFASFGKGKVAGALGLTAPLLVKIGGYPTIVLLHNIMETVDLRSAGFGGNPLVEMLIRFFGNIVTRLILAADLVALTIPKYVEILQSKYGAKNALLAPHGSFEEGSATPNLDLPHGPLQIMTFGKFGTYKRVETLIEAFRLLLARPDTERARPPLELVIAGTDSPNAAGYLEGLRQQYADVPGIRFTGYVAEADVSRIFGEAAVVVFPYTSTTGSSGVLHQAGSYGKAAVLPKIGDFAEVIAEEGYTGEFFEPGNAASLADAIARVIDDPQHRRELAAQNYAASSGLAIADVVDWYLLHFEELLKARRKGKSR